MANNNKNKQIGFILKDLYQYFYEQTVSTDKYVSFETYLMYQMKLAYECGLLNQNDIYDVIENYEKMVDDPDMVLSAEFGEDNKYSRLFNMIYESDFSLYDDLVSMNINGNICPYGDMCYFLKGEKDPSRYRIFFEVAKSARFFYGINALDLYLPYKDERVIANEQKILESDYGKETRPVNIHSKNSLRTISWYLNTHKSDEDLKLLFRSFDRGENFLGIKNTLIDIYDDEDYFVKPKEVTKPKQKRKSLIDRIIEKKIHIDCIE